jgi:excinuclease ABC subunit C
VYLFFAPRSSKSEVGLGHPIYIGKAINIRERVKNHFFQPTYKDKLYIEGVQKIGYIDTGSEIEALVLEAQLIKKHQPKFNSVWRDDKNYFYVAITKDEHPIVFLTHQKNNSNTNYIGPFIEGNALKKTLKYLRRVFPYYTSTKHPKNQCTWCHLGLCPGPNPNLVEYKQNLKKLALILQGKRKTVLYALKKEMDLLAKQEHFEKATEIRDRMLAMERVLEHTHVIENNKSATGDWEKTQEVFKELLNTKNPISKIECYDISNIQGKNAVGSMVVFVDGAPAKSHYKKFRIRMKNEPNDIAMLKEVLTRRLAHPEWGYPQVILIDGGIAQLNVAIKVKGKADIKIISIAKGRQELFIEGNPPSRKASEGQRKEPIPLKDLPQEIYNLIKHLDDEAHRFAITYHKRVHSKSILGR